MENLLQSIAVPEPFSLELAADMDGVTLLARCQDDQVVRGQIAAHYPQARIQDGGGTRRQTRLDLAEGEQAWSMTLRADGPEYVPLRTFRDDDLLDPGSDPLIALMGAMSALYQGERVVARLLLRSLGPEWSQSPPNALAHKAAVPDNREPSYTYQTKPLQLDGVTMAVSWAQGLHWPSWATCGYQDGEYSQGVPPGRWFRHLGLAVAGWAWWRMEAEPGQPGPRPGADPGEGLPGGLRGRAADRRRPASRTPGRSGPGNSWTRWRPPTATTTTRRGTGSGQGSGVRPLLPSANLHPAGPGLDSCRRSVLGSAGGGLPVAPAGRRGRDSPGGALRRQGATALGPGSPGRRPGGRHHRRGQAGRSASPRTCCAGTTSTWPVPAWASPP